MAHHHASTFEAPSVADLRALKVGDLVKVAIKLGQTGERFWVEITEVKGEYLIGRIDNDLVGTSVHGLAFNDLIGFSRDNIYSTTPPP